MVEDTALRHVSVETFFKLDGIPPHLFHHARGFVDREFPDLCIEGGTHSVAPSFFMWGFVK